MIDQLKVAVTCAEMARMVSLSRARFYQLLAEGVFPQPNRSPETGRPFYDEEGQRLCLDVRRRNCGVNGKAVLFYARQMKPMNVPTKTRQTKQATNDTHFEDVLDGVRALGLEQVTAKEVEQIVAELFPKGVEQADRGEVIRAVFLSKKRQEFRG